MKCKSCMGVKFFSAAGQIEDCLRCAGTGTEPIIINGMRTHLPEYNDAGWELEGKYLFPEEYEKWLLTQKNSKP